MTIPFYCILAMIVVTYLSKVPVAIAMAKLGGYNNRTPRDQQAQLTGWGRRALAAHQNSFEVFPVFTAGVFIAHLSGADPVWSARLALLFVVSRVAYLFFYWYDLDKLRSLMWMVGILSSLTLGLLVVF